jgi:hypothetical protein
LLLVAAFAANAALSLCGGWEASAQARAACCGGVKHECSQARADDCCIAGEQRQHSETSSVTLHAVAAPVAASVTHVAAPPARLFRATAFGRSDVPPGSPPDTHLLLSVFLI